MSQKGMNITEVESYLQTLSTGAKDLDQLTQDVKDLQAPLQDCWEGDEAEACVNFIADISSKMSQMSEEVMKIHKWVEDVKTSYEEAATSGKNAYTV